jgi:hypothetical protein
MAANCLPNICHSETALAAEEPAVPGISGAEEDSRFLSRQGGFGMTM